MRIVCNGVNIVFCSCFYELSLWMSLHCHTLFRRIRHFIKFNVAGSKIIITLEPFSEFFFLVGLRCVASEFSISCLVLLGSFDKFKCRNSPMPSKDRGEYAYAEFIAVVHHFHALFALLKNVTTVVCD